MRYGVPGIHFRRNRRKFERTVTHIFNILTTFDSMLPIYSNASQLSGSGMHTTGAEHTCTSKRSANGSRVCSERRRRVCTARGCPRATSWPRAATATRCHSSARTGFLAVLEKAELLQHAYEVHVLAHSNQPCTSALQCDALQTAQRSRTRSTRISTQQPTMSQRTMA